MSLIDDYLLLEIPTHANEQEAKAAFRRLARRYHPDKNPHTDTTEHFQRLQAAYENVLQAIKQGSQGGEWKPYQFHQENSTAKNRYYSHSKATDKEQEAYVKERQKAYEQMKRNSAQQEKAREEAIKAARNTLNEKRVKAMYEEAFKASKGFTSQGYTSDESPSSYSTEYNQRKYSDSQYSSQTYQAHSGSAEQTGDIPPYYMFDDDPTTMDESGFQANRSSRAKPVRLYAAKAAFRAATYIVCFASGIYATLFWQEHQRSTQQEKVATYIPGLYPQYRVGDAYTLTPTNLYSEPDKNTRTIQQLPAYADVQSIKQQGTWLTVRYNNVSGWIQAKDVGFGTIQHAVATGCVGYPGAAPSQGEVIGKADGSSRLRILNHLPEQSILTFQSYDGRKPFSIFLEAKQPFAANFIPQGRYRLVLETGSLYHNACKKFLFNDTHKVVLDNVKFASTEQSLTLNP
ncbi:Chaperone protein DnaJ [Marinomonas spartinae]|uniref:J domain-containing protein n=1 Tax=Marinomonas spartinae TaxID=1792290 RepID=UPI000808F3A4|nr:J domain-containing protein [Marinomonas spartinae]SBS37442.1 Chaperone protein DnaJ [Marinomonas spartinae]